MSIMQINLNDSDISNSTYGSSSDNRLGGVSSSSSSNTNVRSEARTETQSKLFGVKK